MRKLLFVLFVAALVLPAGAGATPSVKTTRLPHLPFGLDLVPAATRLTTIAVVRHGRAQIAYRLAGRRWRRIGRVRADEILVDGNDVCVGALTSRNAGRTFSRSLACEAARPDPAVVATVLHGGVGYRALSDLNAVLVTEPGQAVAVDELEHVQFHPTPPAFAWTDRNGPAGLAVSGSPAEIAFGEAISGDGMIVHRTVDEGGTWLAGAKLANGVAFLPDATVARRLYALVAPIDALAIARSDDAGTTWQAPHILQVNSSGPTGFDVDPVRSGRLVALTENEIRVSDNSAATFRTFGPFSASVSTARADRFGDWFLSKPGGRRISRVKLR